MPTLQSPAGKGIYTICRILVYVTTIRLTAAQKKRLGQASQVLGSVLGRRLSQGETVDALADFALRNRDLLGSDPEELNRPRDDDPFFDPDLTFDFGRTDERSHDRVLYGRG